MPRRGPSLVVRIVRFVLIVFGPLLLSLGLVTWFGSALPSAAAAKLIVDVSSAWLFCSLILTPALLFPESDASVGPSASDGGGGTDPQPRPSLPNGPYGGIALPDAEPWRSDLEPLSQLQPDGFEALTFGGHVVELEGELCKSA